MSTLCNENTNILNESEHIYEDELCLRDNLIHLLEPVVQIKESKNQESVVKLTNEDKIHIKREIKSEISIPFKKSKSLKEKHFQTKNICIKQERDNTESKQDQMNHDEEKTDHHLSDDLDLEKVVYFQCEQCEYKTVNKRRLIKHLKVTHNEIKRFKCNHCDYATSVKAHLATHIEVHDKETNFTCPYCSYKSLKNTYVRNHIQSVHEGIKPNLCHFCSYKAFYKSALTKHIKEVHEKQNFFLCDECDYKTTRKGHLARHMEAVHRKSSDS